MGQRQTHNILSGSSACFHNNTKLANILVSLDNIQLQSLCEINSVLNHRPVRGSMDAFFSFHGYNY